MDFVPIVVLGALIWKFVDFLKFFMAKDWNAVGTQTVAWVAGIAGVLLFAGTQFAAGVDVYDTTLDQLNLTEQVLVGLMATSLISVGVDVKKAIDNSDSAATPKLFNR